MTPKSYWREALSRVKRAVVGRGTVLICGRQYRVAYEARNLGTIMNADYPLLVECARGRRCVLDIGANVGLTSMLMSEVLAPGGYVWALEASEAACMVLRENVLLNSLDDRVRIVRAVLGDKPGSLVHFFWDHFSTNASIMGMASSEASIPLGVATTRVDDLVKAGQLEPDFVKIDVEGAEALVVRGMLDTLTRYRPLVYVELHSWAGHKVSHNVREIFDAVEPIGYRILDLRTKQIQRDPSFLDHVELGRYEVVSQGRVLLVDKDFGPPGWLDDFDTSRL